MRFMIIRKAGSGAMPVGEHVQATSTGARVTFSGGTPTVQDGPFSEDEELVAGLTMIDAASKDEAVAWVKRWPALDGQPDVDLEIREVGCPGGVTGRGLSTPAEGGAPRFLILLKADANAEAGIVADQTRLAAMATRNEESMKSGVMLAGEGLQPSSKGARVKFSGGKPAVIDGPFTEAKELVAGFWLIQVRSKDEAIAWVTRYPYPSDDAEVEIRQVLDVSDVE